MVFKKIMNTKEYNFVDSLEIGKQGELIIKHFLEQTFDIVADVSDIKEYQLQDIDYVCTKGNTSITIEVKTDTYKSGNLYYEYYSCLERQTEGCMQKTKADIICYYFINTNELYILNTEQFRLWVNKNLSRFRPSLVTNIMGTKMFHSQGYCVPKKFLENTFRYYKKIILKDVSSIC